MWKVDSATFHLNVQRRIAACSPAGRFATVGKACRRSYLSAHGTGPQRNPTFEGTPLLFRIRMLIAVALTAAVVSAAAPATANATQRRQMVRAINFVRGWSHRHHLRFSPRLSHGAGAWARHLMRRDVLAHSARAIRRHEGEVIEWHSGRRARVNKTVIEWLGSSGHRHVMLARRYRMAGAGKAVGYIGGRKCTIWVVRFAR